MMSDVNWWLMALAFVLGLVLMLALTVRRVKREVPVYGALGRGPGVGGAATADTATAGAAAGAATAKVAGGKPDAATAKVAGGKPDAVDEPYGAGSIRVAPTADGPAGYTVKGNEDSMLYHTAESPSYKQTIAEIWFRDAAAAEAAGFARWDSGKSQREKK